MKTQKPKLKKNMEGAFIGGRFRPFRSSPDYDPFLAGDFDMSREEKAARKAKNDRKEQQRYERSIERELENDLRDMSETRESLTQFVRSAGGLHFDEKTTPKAVKGELRRLTFKESGKRGIAHAKGKYTPDMLREKADEFGFPGMNTEHDFLSALEKDLTGRKRIYATAEGGSTYKRNPNARRKSSAAQMAFDFGAKSAKPASHIPAILIPHSYLKKPEYRNLRYEGADGNDTYYQDGKYRYFTRENPQKMKANPAQKTPAKTPAKPNGFLSGFVARHRAGRALKTELRHEAAAGRARKKKDALIRKAKGQTDRTARQIPSVLVNPAQVVKIKGFFQVKLPGGKFLRDTAGRIWKSRTQKAALELASITKLSGSDEMKWLDKVSARRNPKAARKPAKGKTKRAARKNPGIGELLSHFANAAVGTASALAIHDRLKSPAKQKGKTAPVKTKAKINPPKARAKSNAAAKTRNPARIPARKTFEMFQGRKAETANPMPVSIHAPGHLDQLGDLIEIKLESGRTLNFAERKNNPFKLCATAKRLWIAGGSIAKANPKLNGKQIEIIEPIEYVVYGTHKPHHGDDNYTHYIHHLGEETGNKPMLGVDKLGFPVIHGGSYSIEGRGIVD